MIAQTPNQRDGLFDIPSARPPNRSPRHAQTTASAPATPVRTASHDLEAEPDAIVERPAIFVVPGVHERRQKLVDQIAVRGVNFDDVEARLERARRRDAKRVDDVADVDGGHLARHWIVVRERRRRRRDRLPAAFGWRDLARLLPGPPCAALAPRMRQLNAGVRALLVWMKRTMRARPDT